MLAVVAALTIASCTEPAPAIETNPTVSNDPVELEPPPPAIPDHRPIIELGPLVGGARRLSTPIAGRYASSIIASQSVSLGEFTLGESVDGGASLELREDGSAHACVWTTSTDSGSMSEFVSDDRRPHNNRTTDTYRLGMRGTWVADSEASQATVQFTTRDHRTCEPNAKAPVISTPSIMTCHALTAGGGLPVAALICRQAGDFHEVAMALEPSPRSGPWVTRDDVAARHPPSFGPEVEPWLLLGTPGLRITAHNADNQGKALSVKLLAADVPTPSGTLERR